MCISLSPVTLDYESERVIPAIIDQSSAQLRGRDFPLVRTLVGAAPAQANSHLQRLTIGYLHTQKLRNCGACLCAVIAQDRVAALC
ncbi:hypothetical protein AWB74_08272 [Caballeronia arvi]|uniref:Uncharacterized protein n=1 Tax=Caballeronia arvi TaxID=1777135 RepID=A0A158L358_9BURK|nr:hypothetical protein [Caballeronia arvi]SAL87804.1 hypothetical protein AWB74_08272 [Caballeronia arvi]